jgi:hypothetical protein
MGKKKSVRRATSADSGAATVEDFLQQAEPFMAVLNQKATTDQEKAKHLRAYHRLGALSRALAPDHGGYGDGVLKEHAEAVGRTYRFLSLARRFADRYDAKELKQLCQTPIGVSHLRALVDVENKRQRVKLQKQAYDQKLSVAALFELKKHEIDPKPGGGASVKIADSPKTAVLNLLSDGDAWARRCEATISKLKETSGKRELADVQDVAEEGIERLKAVAKAARQAEKQLKRLSGEA